MDTKEHNRDSEAFLIEKTLENGQQKLRDSNLRWLALAFACFTCVGDYYCTNLFTALQPVIKEEFKLGEDNTKFNLLSSIGSLPGIVLPFVGGMFIDRLGVRPVYLFASISAIIGYSIITFGIARVDFNLLIFGKLIAAFGSGPLYVSKSSMLVKWFAGKELSVSLGAALVISRLASSLDSIVSPRVYEWSHVLAYPFLIGVGVCVIAFMAVVSLCYIDKKADLQEMNIQAWETATAKVSTTEKPQQTLRDVLTLPTIYFLLILNVGLITPPLLVWNGNLADLVVKRFSVPLVQAGELVPILYYISFFMTPLVGFFVDKQGKRLYVLALVMVIFLFSHLYICFLDDAPVETPNYDVIIGLIGIGIFYSTYSAVLWPSLALVVKKEFTGLAFGIGNSVQSITGVIFPLAFAYVHDKTKDYKHGYFWSEIVAAACVILGLFVLAIIVISDKRNGGRLQRAGTEREQDVVKVSRSTSNADLLN